ncbi:hypothetical protein ACRE_042530 [Hapsidospora chrysogenum ATCC 11550]|uniref:Uncharacterized protein n=1 Tax=Hapsidospora chrysogenum (strain ATCC 11550 / CBS 779.69 / DSM 880 / IAM 14645 / JCM 23072 / IMI 49137) TaxID=857340 RepID=A0A086T6D9_HAPC1|nr:hypothetical protein ACRE_042530 [Hapsidospora chrysogenum ATCC 11550]
MALQRGERQPSRLSSRSSAGSESRQIAGLCTDRGVFREARLLVRRDQEVERWREVVVREPGSRLQRRGDDRSCVLLGASKREKDAS